jgi:hypothetical protein
MRSQFGSETFKNRLGYYQVGHLKIKNAHRAMVLAKKLKLPRPVWNFNEDVFKLYDWSTPIETSLDDLYKIRAQQLRNEYDYLILNFSGGRDSINILLTFLNNNIFLDEIVMNYPFPMESGFNNNDTSSNNNFSEIEFAAKVILDKYKHLIDPRTIIRYQDLAEPNLKILAKDDWFDILPAHTSCTVTSRMASYLYDEKIIDLAMNQKRVASILGIDKPRVLYENGTYFASFSDLPMHAVTYPSLPEHREMVDKYIHPEPFYWTPFLPELVIKQAQVIVSVLDIDPVLRDVIKGTMTSNDKHRDMMIKERLMCDYLYSDGEQVWQTEKLYGNIFRPLDRWFWELAPDKTKANFMDALRQLSDMTDSSEFVDGDIINGKKPHFSGKYFLKRVVHD